MEIRRTAEIVKEILSQKKTTRDDDFKLYGFVLNHFGLSFSTPFITIADMVKSKQIPSMETVGRCRRRVQELYPELQGTERTTALRDSLQLEYVDFIQDRGV